MSMFLFKNVFKQRFNDSLLLKAVFLIAFIICVIDIKALCFAEEDNSHAAASEVEADIQRGSTEGFAVGMNLQEKDIKAKIEEKKQAIQQKELEAEKAKKEASEILAEKEILKQKADEKDKEALVVTQELKVAQEEAAIARNSRDKSRIKDLALQAEQLRSEAGLLKRKAALEEQKVKNARERALAREMEAASLKEGMEQLSKEKLENRSLAWKMFSALIIIILGGILFLFLRFAVNKFESAISSKDVIRESEQTLRLKTLGRLFRWLSGIVVFILVTYGVLLNFGFDATLLVAGAGMVGLAFGFGGQYLIRDIINGIFILLEGQYRVNDVVRIADEGGLVEDINLRITTLRDLEGRVIIIPNGEVKKVINYTREYAQALLDIGVAYKEDVDRVMGIIKIVGEDMRQDPYFKRLILAPLEMFGVDDFADSQVTIKFRIKTLPIKQWEVAREFRRRLKKRFDEEGIEIPFPHRTLYLGTGKDNEWLKEYAMQEKVQNNLGSENV